MTSQAESVELLVKKGQFEPRVAMAIVEAIDTAMTDSQIVTVPILDARLAELRADGRISEQVLKSEIGRVEQGLKSEIVRLDQKIDSTRESLEKTMEAISHRTRADVVRWVLLAMLGSAALSTAGAFVTHAMHQ